ncbi:Dabb family protein [Paracoccus sediminilitoris]|uniref:Dabb family protein n=1 Tax=Paracoccus sediminilitoris TaxID=2202419 RepID=UPI000DB9504C|nr:Dabb family protein [Paracoccus sediminilitoris]
MIRHIVLIKFKPEVSESCITEIYSGLWSLTNKLPGARHFTGGRSASPEQIERGYFHAFVIDFDTWLDLKKYTDHPEHQALGSQIVKNAINGLDGLLVLDLEVPATD